jgi:spoIIIJ-associated protein
VSEKYTLAEAKPRIEQFLNKVFDLAGFKLDFAVTDGETPHPDFENPDLMVRFSGPDVDSLLANKAELLLALEQLTMEALAMPSEEHSRVCFDANDYRVLRIEELRMLALTAAEQVAKTKVPFNFTPMNSRERRILHLSLRGQTAVRSESVGMGPIRQVVIVPIDAKVLPEPVIPPRPRPEDDTPRPRFGGRGGPGRGGPGGGRGGDRDRRGGPPRGRR